MLKKNHRPTKPKKIGLKINKGSKLVINLEQVVKVLKLLIQCIKLVRKQHLMMIMAVVS